MGYKHEPVKARRTTITKFLGVQTIIKGERYEIQITRKKWFKSV